MKSVFATIAIAIILNGCATSSEEVVPQYTSPLKYQKFSCEQISMEETRLSRKILEISGTVDKSASDATGGQVAATLLFWPALFFTQQDKAKVNELSRLLGDYDALEQASIESNCDVRFKKPSPE